jgi:hypothetical protein
LHQATLSGTVSFVKQPSASQEADEEAQMRLPTITIKPLQITLTEEEILADLIYPARPDHPGAGRGSAS